MRSRQVGKLRFLRALRERTGMMYQQLLHQICRQPKERGFLIRSVRTSRSKGFDFDQFEIELMHDCGGLERVILALGTHARGGNPPEFRVEELDQPAGGLLVAVAKARHQPGYGISLKRGWGGHTGSQSNLRKKNSKGAMGVSLSSPRWVRVPVESRGH